MDTATYQSTAGRQVLVVEDSALLARIAADSLREAGFGVATAASLLEAHDAISRTRPDLVLLDLTLPDGDGMEVLPAMRDLLPDAPVIVLSSRQNLNDRVRALRLGANDFLVKPVVAEELVARCELHWRLGSAPRADALAPHGLRDGQAIPLINDVIGDMDITLGAAKKDGLTTNVVALQFADLTRRTSGNAHPRLTPPAHVLAEVLATIRRDDAVAMAPWGTLIVAQTTPADQAAVAAKRLVERARIRCGATTTVYAGVSACAADDAGSFGAHVAMALSRCQANRHLADAGPVGVSAEAPRPTAVPASALVN